MSGRVALATPDRRLRRNVIFNYRLKCEETGESIVIPVGVIRVLKMTAKELREQNLYHLIPFIQLKTRQLVNEKEKNIKNKLIFNCKEIINDSIMELRKMFTDGKLTSEEYGELMAIQQKVMMHLYYSVPDIMEGVEARMVASEVLTYGQKLRIQITKEVTQQVTQEVTNQVTYNIFNRIDELVQGGLSYEDAVHTAEREAKMEDDDVV